MSFFEQASFATGENAELISLSVVASVHCCIVISGVGEPARIVFISHRPALRTGSSTAPASDAGSSGQQTSAQSQ